MVHVLCGLIHCCALLQALKLISLELDPSVYEKKLSLSNTAVDFTAGTSVFGTAHLKMQQRACHINLQHQSPSLTTHWPDNWDWSSHCNALEHSP